MPLPWVEPEESWGQGIDLSFYTAHKESRAKEINVTYLRLSNQLVAKLHGFMILVKVDVF